MIVAPVKISTRFMAAFIGLTTISSVPRTSSTSKPNRLPPWRTTTMYSVTTGSRFEAAYFFRISALVSAVNGRGLSNTSRRRMMGSRRSRRRYNFGVEGLLDPSFQPGMQTDGFFQLALGDRIPLAVHADDQAGNDRQR